MRTAIALLFAVVGLSAQGAAYYVATTGSDAANGSSGSPWLTLDRAMLTTVGGDSVTVSNGVYTTASQTYRNATNSPITITGDGMPIFRAKITLAHSNYVVQGIRMETNRIELFGAGANHNLIQSNFFTRCVSSGVYCERNGSNTGTNVTSFNRIVSNTFSNMLGDGSIAVMGISNTISSNLFINLNGWDAIVLWGIGTHIHDNTFTGCISGTESGTGNHADIFQTFNVTTAIEAKNIIIERNTFSNNSCTLGMLQQIEGATTHTNWIFRNNFLWNCRLQCEIFFPGFQVYANTIVSNSSGLGFRFASGEAGNGTADNGQVFNNIFAECVSAYVFHTSTTGGAANYNLFTAPGGGALTLQDVGVQEGVYSINGGYSLAQIFSNPAAHAGTLIATSPAVGAGIDLSALFTGDITGATRSAPWDMGAYEYGSEPTPPSGATSTALSVTVGDLIIE